MVVQDLQLSNMEYHFAFVFSISVFTKLGSQVGQLGFACCPHFPLFVHCFMS